MDILNKVLGAVGGGGQNPLVSMITGMLAGSGQQGGSGLAALVQQFQQNGLGEQVQSWIGSGANLPISADQIQQALGSGRIAEMAKASGLSDGDLSGQLADLLPQVVDKLTPGGQLPDGEPGMGSIASVLGSLLGGRS